MRPAGQPHQTFFSEAVRIVELVLCLRDRPYGGGERVNPYHGVSSDASSRVGIQAVRSGGLMDARWMMMSKWRCGLIDLMGPVLVQCCTCDPIKCVPLAARTLGCCFACRAGRWWENFRSHKNRSTRKGKTFTSSNIILKLLFNTFAFGWHKSFCMTRRAWQGWSAQYCVDG